MSKVIGRLKKLTEPKNKPISDGRQTVSVVIPAYNEESNIGECLASLQIQSRQPDEVIVVNNNSTDDTAIIAEKMGVKVIHESEQGIFYARTAGFDAASGDVIIRLDADCLAMPDYVEQVMSNFESDPDVDGLAGGMIIKEWHDKFPVLAKKTPQALSKTYHKMLCGGGVMMLGFSMAIRNDFWRNIREEVMEMHDWANEDVQLSIIANRRGTIAQDEEALVICEVSDSVKPKKAMRYIIDDARTMSYQMKKKRDEKVVVRRKKQAERKSKK